MIGILGQQLLAIFSDIRRAGVHSTTPDFHHGAAIGFGAKRSGYLPDFALQSELRAGKRQRAPPLARPSLGGELADTLLRVVPNLRHSGVGFV